jgi:magnesium-transporting ATPase (P-type)
MATPSDSPPRESRVDNDNNNNMSSTLHEHRSSLSEQVAQRAPDMSQPYLSSSPQLEADRRSPADGVQVESLSLTMQDFTSSNPNVAREPENKSQINIEIEPISDKDDEEDSSHISLAPQSPLASRNTGAATTQSTTKRRRRSTRGGSMAPEEHGWPKPRYVPTRFERFRNFFCDIVGLMPCFRSRSTDEAMSRANSEMSLYRSNKRAVFANDIDSNTAQQYESNSVSTTQYTPFTFLPKNLYEQLGKAANFYFFVLAVVVSIPGVSPIEPWTNISPLVLVLSVTAIREAWEDFKRHRDDKTVNQGVTRIVVDGRLIETEWQHVRVGDIVKVYETEQFPCDMIMLSSSMPQGECSIETSNLDGETAFKTRHSLRQTHSQVYQPEDETIQEPVELANMRLQRVCNIRGAIRCDLPNSDLHDFAGQWIERIDPDSDISGVDPSQVPVRDFPITHEELLMRGTSLMNTEYVFGIVVYCGHQTKIHLNLNDAPHKRTHVERVANREMYKIFLLLFFVCLFAAIGYSVRRADMWDKHWYLGYSSLPNWASEGVRDWAAFLILYSLMVPISLYVSIEIVRAIQTVMIFLDDEIYDPDTDTRAIARQAALNEELGNIDYVFCDKTGTLTENQMAFAKCSIGGIPYGISADDATASDKGDTDNESDFGDSGDSDSYEQGRLKRRKSRLLRHDSHLRRNSAALFPEMKLHDAALMNRIENVDDETVREYLYCLSLCHSVNPLLREEEERRETVRRVESMFAEISPQRSASSALSPRSARSAHSPRNRRTPSAFSTGAVPHCRPHSGSGSQSPNGLYSPPISPKNRAGDDLRPHSFGGPLHLDLELPPHSLSRRPSAQLTDVADFYDFDVAYQASSPDEMALVTAARSLGYYFHTRERSAISDRLVVDSPNRPREEFHLLHTLEFTSLRKRMSVIVRCPDGKIKLYCKGADSVIKERLSPNNDPDTIAKTDDHLSLFSQMGLRVMLVAVATIPNDVFNDWSERYIEASKSLENRKDKMESLQEEIERELLLLGSTAIEDKLQDGVPDTIASLRRAGIKVWILTGDKQETAVNIGKSCMLIDNNELQFVSTGCELAKLPNSIHRDSVWSMGAVQDYKETAAAIQRQVSSLQMTALNDEKSGTQEVDQELARHISSLETKARTVVNARREDRKRRIETGQNLHSILNRIELRKRLLDEENGVASPTTTQDDDTKHDGTSATTERPRANSDSIPMSDAEKQHHLNMARVGIALIIDGPTLRHALHRDNVRTFVQVLNHSQCKVVVCARLAPRQKASVVDLIRVETGASTLAIGDGANDVSMIQAAHVGVGISGREGRQAVNASDFSIARFHFLKKLVLVHGRYSYTRNTMLVLYFFYKGFSISWVQVWLSLFTAGSDQEMFDGILLNSFNLFWTSLPILVLATFDRDLDVDECLKYPEVYKDRESFTTARFWSWAGMGVIHSVFIFFLPFYALQFSENQDFWSTSIAVFTVLVHVVNIKLAVMHNSWSWVNIGVIGMSLLAWWGTAFLYTSTDLLTFASHATGTFTNVVNIGNFWWAFLLACVLAALPDIIYRYYQRQWKPTSRMIIQERKILGMPLPNIIQEAPKMSEIGSIATLRRRILAQAKQDSADQNFDATDHNNNNNNNNSHNNSNSNNNSQLSDSSVDEKSKDK